MHHLLGHAHLLFTLSLLNLLLFVLIILDWRAEEWYPTATALDYERQDLEHSQRHHHVVVILIRHAILIPLIVALVC